MAEFFYHFSLFTDVRRFSETDFVLTVQCEPSERILGIVTSFRETGHFDFSILYGKARSAQSAQTKHIRNSTPHTREKWISYCTRTQANIERTFYGTCIFPAAQSCIFGL